MKNKSRLVIKIEMLILLILFCYSSFSQEKIFEYAEENQKCLVCHGYKNYNYLNTWLEKMVRERMNPYFIIDSAEYYSSNHRNFSCTDCHSSDYTDFPHSGELRMEPKFACIDCHGGDETYAKFNFEQIEEEFHNSIHSSKHSDEFTCWMCHNPHTYKISARSNEQLKEIIQYDNNICLSCHADVSKYQLLTTLENPNVLLTHEWLPNQVLHFQNVRCIECHTEISNNVLVAHKVQTKDKAVQLCTECHSQNSLLRETLYKYQKEGESIYSPGNIDSTKLIGGKSNYTLNKISIFGFFVTMICLLIHSTLRIILKPK